MSLTREMVQDMTTEEKFSAIDMIWSTILPVEADDFEVPAWHLRLLSRRLNCLRSGNGHVLPMEDAFAELDARIAQ